MLAAQWPIERGAVFDDDVIEHFQSGKRGRQVRQLVAGDHQQLPSRFTQSDQRLDHVVADDSIMRQLPSNRMPAPTAHCKAI